MNPSTSESSPPVSQRKRTIYTPEQIQQHVQAFGQSGLGAAAYARQHDLGYTTLMNWLRRYGPVAESQTAQPQFQTMSLSSLVGPAWAAEVVGPSGLTLRLSGQAPANLVLQLLSFTAKPC